MAGVYTQRRNLAPHGVYPRYKSVGDNGTVYFNDTVFNIASDQVTTSFRTGKGESLVSESELRENNNSLNNLLQTQGVAYDTGHAFSTVKHECFGNYPVTSRYSAYYKRTFTGPYVAKEMNSFYIEHYPQVPSWESAASDGNTAILKTNPTQPKVALAQTVVELKREGLPSLFGSQIASMKGSAARAIGGEFLNSVFGWTPLISDLDKLLKAVVSSSQTIQQMRRDSGRIVRRKYNFPTTTELVSSISMRGHTVIQGGDPMASGGTLLIETTMTTKKWFSGAYTYYLDPGDTLVGKAIMYEQLANKLLGLRITPATLWELAPWSWLSDWFVNIGDNINVASAFQQDGLILKYGYVMRHVVVTRMYTYTPDPSNKTDKASYTVLRTTSKERVKASPFGFGVNINGLNDRQWAILGALGLTKAPRSLR